MVRVESGDHREGWEAIPLAFRKTEEGIAPVDLMGVSAVWPSSV